MVCACRESRVPVQLEKTDEQEYEGEAYQPKALLPFMKRLPAKRVAHLPEAARDPVEFSLSLNESLPLPQGISTTQLANYHVTGDTPQHTWQPSRPCIGPPLPWAASPSCSKAEMRQKALLGLTGGFRASFSESALI